MSRKKIGGILIAAVLCLAVMISIGIVAAGEETAQQTMTISDEMLDVLKQLEGFSPYAYWDYQQWSIGYGSKCPEGYEAYYDKDRGGNQITLEYAEELLRNELDYFETTVNNFIARNNLTLQQHQFDALVSFTYNTGYGWTSTTGNLVTAVIGGDSGSHLLYGMMLWSMAGKPERHILINRRIVETSIYASGVYPEDVYADEATPDRYRIAFMDGNGGTVNYNEHGFDAEQPIAIKTKFKSNPTGPDETGALVTYEFDGWYTERVGGTKVEVLDETIPTGTMLYAHWKTPGGTPVTISHLKSDLRVKVTVTSTDVNVRFGPETYYASLYKAVEGDVLEIEEVTTRGGLLWGRIGDTWVSLKHTNYSEVIQTLFPIWGKVTSTTLNVRTGAGTSYSLVSDAQKQQGDMVLITEWKTDESMMWGKTAEGWIALPYVTFQNITVPDQTVQSVKILSAPTKLTYVHKAESLDLTGGQILVTYADGSHSIVQMTAETVTGFDNTNVGTNTVTVTYGGQTATFQAEIVKAKVIFKMDDGTVISEKEYLYGETVEIPADPAKATDEGGYYVFKGWGAEVSATCTGSVTYVAQFAQKELVGDLNGDLYINDRDAIYLLGYTLFPEDYPVKGTADMNGDGFVNDRDAIYLLGYTLFPEDYPLPQ